MKKKNSLYQKLMGLTDTIGELLLLYLGVILVAATIFSLVEHKPLIDAIWWACVTGMTVGYGDMYPATLIGRIVAVVLMHLTVLFVLPLLIARVAMTLIENRNEFSHEEQEKIKEDIAAIKKHFSIN